MMINHKNIFIRCFSERMNINIKSKSPLSSNLRSHTKNWKRCLSSFDSMATNIHLSKDHPTHLIFGANTDVGKTVLSTALVQSNVRSNTNVDYIKPLGCGPYPTDVDFVRRHVLGNNDGATVNDTWRQLVNFHSLFQWDTPASPHLASRSEDVPKSDEEVLQALRKKIVDIQHSKTHGMAQSQSQGEHRRLLIELAGGVLSPSSASPMNNHSRHANGLSGATAGTGNDPLSWGWSTQADVFQPIRLPVILVGDGKLGGISTTLSSLESLLVRGYDVHAIVLIDDDVGYSNSSHRVSNRDALEEYIANRVFQLRSGGGRTILRGGREGRGGGIHNKANTAIISLPPLPPQPEPLMEWFDSDEVVEKVRDLEEILINSWKDDIECIDGLIRKGTDVLWWPFTQHKPPASTNNKKENTAILVDAASGDNFSILKASTSSSSYERTSQFDACASWWTQGLGHGESSLALAAAAAAGRYGHVLFPNVVNEPSVQLANKLLHNSNGVSPGYGWASRVFFSDDGSTAMEVAIKMGMKKYCYDRGLVMGEEGEEEGDTTVTGNDNNCGKILTVCAQKDCYHGDTLGVMDVAEPSIFNKGQHPWYEPKGLFLSYPTIGYSDGVLKSTLLPDVVIEADDNQDEFIFGSIEDAMDVEKRLASKFYNVYLQSIQSDWDKFEQEEGGSRVISSVIIEPLLLGAGGMRFVDPLWQRALIDFAKSKSVPVIFDEVATGIFRLGVSSCREILKSDPDIASYAKLLTGGLVPMSVTLASEDVFNTFLGDSKAEALLHGHSYTAHPVGCVSAIHALETYEKLFCKNGERDQTATDDGASLRLQHYFNPKEVSELSTLPNVQESMSLGTVLAVTIRPEDGGESGYGAASLSAPVVKYLFDNGVYARPLGNVVYIMVSPLTSSEKCSRLCQILREALVH